MIYYFQFTLRIGSLVGVMCAGLVMVYASLTTFPPRWPGFDWLIFAVFVAIAMLGITSLLMMLGEYIIMVSKGYGHYWMEYESYTAMTESVNSEDIKGN